MGETRPRFQFGLRKLLLWTAVVALFLGILKMLGLGPILCIAVLCWAMFVRGLRLVFGFTQVAFASVLSASILTSARFCMPPLAVNWREATLLAAALGAVYGYVAGGCLRGIRNLCVCRNRLSGG